MQQISVGALSRCHPAWASEGKTVDPGKDTHGTLGPEKQEGSWVARQDQTEGARQTSSVNDVMFMCLRREKLL